MSQHNNNNQLVCYDVVGCQCKTFYLYMGGSSDEPTAPCYCWYLIIGPTRSDYRLYTCYLKEEIMVSLWFTGIYSRIWEVILHCRCRMIHLFMWNSLNKQWYHNIIGIGIIPTKYECWWYAFNLINSCTNIWWYGCLHNRNSLMHHSVVDEHLL